LIPSVLRKIGGEGRDEIRPLKVKITGKCISDVVGNSGDVVKSGDILVETLMHTKQPQKVGWGFCRGSTALPLSKRCC